MRTLNAEKVAAELIAINSETENEVQMEEDEVRNRSSINKGPYQSDETIETSDKKKKSKKKGREEIFKDRHPKFESCNCKQLKNVMNMFPMKTA